MNLKSMKEKKILTHAITWMNLNDIWLSDISQSQKDCESTYGRFLKESDSQRQKAEQWVPGTRREKGQQEGQIENFQGSGTILYHIIRVDTCHDAFVQPHKMYSTKVNSNVNMDFGDDEESVQVHQCNYCTLWSGMQTVEEDMCWGDRGYMEIVNTLWYFSLTFAVNLKLLFEIYILKNNTEQ